MNEHNVTEELKELMSHMINSVATEFTTPQILTEHLLISILDCTKCHAYMILDNFLMSSNIEHLKNIYINFFNNKIISGIEPSKIFNEELENIIKGAEFEQNKCKSLLMGSEHILLSMLNPLNSHTNIIEVFKNIGIDYDIVFSKCSNILIEKPNKKNLKIHSLLSMKNDKNIKMINTKTDYISQYTVNINKLVQEGKIDPLIGRQKEIDNIIKVLARRKKNNAILVGQSGCGKTQIIYGIASLIEQKQVPEILQNKEIVKLDIIALVSGTHFRGMFEERVNGLFDALKHSPKYILFIDDMQNVLKSSSKDKDTDISSMIMNVLSEGDIRVIGTTNFKEYKNSIESNPSISSKLQKIIIDAPSKEETLDILNSIKGYYEDFHNVKYSDEALTKTIQLATRYITTRTLPDSAIDILDLSGAQTCLINKYPPHIVQMHERLQILEKEQEENLNNGNFEILDTIETEMNDIKKEINNFKRYYESHKKEFTIEITVDDITKAVSDITNIPINKLNVDEKHKLAEINQVLKKDIIGQDEAIDDICRIIKRNKVGLGNKNKTQGNVLLLGPSGVGKTLLAKKIAEEIFGSENDLVRIDMSEYSEKHSVAKLTGAAPGYVGYENGGQLTEAIKNKQHCVLLLDEIEKADPEVYNLFLQLFDEGRLTDSSGQVVNFKNVIVLMTSNIGAKQAADLGKSAGFVTQTAELKKSIIQKQLKQTFTPEFLNRIDKIVFFNHLNEDNLKEIVKLEINKLNERLLELNYQLNYDNNVVDFIYNLTINEKEYGARPIIRLIQNYIEDQITDLLLHNDYNKNYIFKVYIENGKLQIK